MSSSLAHFRRALNASSRTVRCEHCGQLLQPPAPSIALVTAPTIDDEARRAIALELEGCYEDTWRVFATLFGPRIYLYGDQLAVDLGVTPSTLSTRLFRWHLPSPCALVKGALLVRAARLFEDRRASVRAVAIALGYPEPNTLHRLARALFGMPATTLRLRYDGHAMLDHFIATHVRPYRATWREVQPLTGTLVSPGQARRILRALALS